MDSTYQLHKHRYHSLDLSSLRLYSREPVDKNGRPRLLHNTNYQYCRKATRRIVFAYHFVGSTAPTAYSYRTTLRGTYHVSLRLEHGSP